MQPQSKEDIKQAIDRLNRIRESQGTHDLMMMPEQVDAFTVDELKEPPVILTGGSKGRFKNSVMGFVAKIFRKGEQKNK